MMYSKLRLVLTIVATFLFAFVGCGGIDDAADDSIGYDAVSYDAIDPDSVGEVDEDQSETHEEVDMTCTSDEECDDGNTCTEDLCWSGECKNRPVGDYLACDDDSPCTGEDLCQPDGMCSGTPLTIQEVLETEYWGLEIAVEEDIDIPDIQWNECWGQPKIVEVDGQKSCEVSFKRDVPCRDVTAVGDTVYWSDSEEVHEDSNFISSPSWWPVWKEIFVGTCYKGPGDDGFEAGCLAVAPRCTQNRDRGEQCQIDSLEGFEDGYLNLVYNGAMSAGPMKECFDPILEKFVECEKAFCEGFPGCNDFSCINQTLPIGSHCGNGQTCNGRGLCNDTTHGSVCQEDEHCGDGYACTAETCEEGVCISKYACYDDDPETLDHCDREHWGPFGFQDYYDPDVSYQCSFPQW